MEVVRLHEGPVGLVGVSGRGEIRMRNEGSCH